MVNVALLLFVAGSIAVWFWGLPFLRRRHLYRQSGLSELEFHKALNLDNAEEDSASHATEIRGMLARRLHIRDSHVLPYRTLESYLVYWSPVTFALDEIIEDVNWTEEDGALGSLTVEEVVRKVMAKAPNKVPLGTDSRSSAGDGSGGRLRH